MNNERLAELKEKYKDRNLLEELAWGAYANHSGYTSIQNGEFLNWLCMMAYKTLKEREWCSVSKRLPDNDDEYLVNDVEGNFGVGYYREDAKAWDSCNWGWLERSNSADDTCPPGIGKVIAWQPLPEPYTENNYDTSDT